jgi:DNA-binding HxlR family transcriptional regulator
VKTIVTENKPPIARFDVPPGLAAMAPQTLAEYAEIVSRVETFAQHVGDSMRNRPAEASNFVRQCVEATHLVFQKWNVEILYLLGLSERLRFSQLKRMLPGISSRTLSLKLAELEKQGLLHREVTKDRPVRVDYNLTVAGRTMSRLTVPLVVFLNMRRGLDKELRIERDVLETA